MFRIVWFVLSILLVSSSARAEEPLYKIQNFETVQWVYDLVQREGMEHSINGKLWKKTYTLNGFYPGQKVPGPCNDIEASVHEDGGKLKVLVLQSRCSVPLGSERSRVKLRGTVIFVVIIEEASATGFAADATELEYKGKVVFPSQKALMKRITSALELAVKGEKGVRKNPEK